MNKYLIFIGFLLLWLQGWGQQDSLLTIQQAVESAYNRNAELQQLHAQLLQKENMWKTETGKKGHQAVRILMGAGCQEVKNISGGHTSLQRFAITNGVITSYSIHYTKLYE